MKTSLPPEQNLELIKSVFINSYAENNLVILFGILFLILIIQFFLLRNEPEKLNDSKPISKILMRYALLLLSLFFTSCQLKTYPQADISVSARKSCNAMSHCSATSSRNSLNDFSHSNHSQYKYCVCCGQKFTKRF